MHTRTKRLKHKQKFSDFDVFIIFYFSRIFSMILCAFLLYFTRMICEHMMIVQRVDWRFFLLNIFNINNIFFLIFSLLLLFIFSSKLIVLQHQLCIDQQHCLRLYSGFFDIPGKNIFLLDV